MVYCELISNLVVFTIAIATQQILLPHLFPDFEQGNKLAVCMLVLLVNIIVTSIMHIMAMLIGKFCLGLK